MFKIPKTMKFFTSKCGLALVAAMMIGTSGAEVLISEFMAKNDSTLADGDGGYSDWIELYNTGSGAVDLTGWYLSDDATDLTKWVFPSKAIAPGEYLIIFASGQATAGYTDPSGYLHTTFKLNGDTESVVLTQADGVTIENSIIDYPAQSDDVSYGIPSDSTFSTLVASDAAAKALVPTSASAGATWQLATYDDTGWLSGDLGVGYDSATNATSYTPLIGLNVASMKNSNGSVYVRVPFNVSDADAIASLSLRMKYDDGFVAYLNGVEVARVNAPATLAYNSLASPALTTENIATYTDFDVSASKVALQDGANILAFQGLNSPIFSSDMLLVAELNAALAGELQIGTLSYLPTPTAGTANLAGFLGYVGDTSFSIDRGFYTTAIAVEITCDTVDSQIYYTTDGTIPATDNGTLYSAPITINKTTVVRAAAFVTGYQPSNVDTQTYLFPSDIIAQGTSVTALDPYFPPNSVNGQVFDYGMDTDITNSSTYSGEMQGALKAIPSISMVTDPANLFNASTGIYVNADEEGDAWERETSIELINPDGTKGFQINGGMRIRGASSTSSSNGKHSFRFFFRSEYGKSRLEYPLFGEDGVDSFKRMDLRTGQNFSWAHQTPQYATWLYDIFTRDTHRDMNQPHTRGEYYHLYINGMYWGLYQTEERCNADFAESYYGDDDDDFDAVKSDADSGDMYAVDGTRDAYEDLWSGVTAGVTTNAAYFALQGMNADGSENASNTKLLDVDNVIDYMLLIYFTANRDSPIGPPHQATMPRNLNLIYNRANPDGFKFVAHDNEHSLEISEGVNHNRFNQSLSSSFDGVNRMTPWWIHLKLINNAEYKLRFADRVHQHFFNNGNLTASKNQSRMETRKSEIFSAVVAESARWGDSKSTTPRTRNDDWLTWADWLTDTYMSQRTTIVYNQIVAKGWYPSVAAPVFNQHGGSIVSNFSLSMTGSGTIYYTTDGSDPREVGGSVAGTAYNSSIPLAKSTQVKARALSNGTWSALTTATFEVSDLSPLRVTEIMYHPAVGTSGDELNFNDEDFEFIELLNTGAETIGLTGTEFNGGIYFAFSEGDVLTLDPGEYVLVVNNLAAFTARYPDAAATTNIAGEYHGKFYLTDGEFDNGGETITLVDSLGRTIQEFTYDDIWHPLTDGEGYSLTLIDPTADTATWSASTSWRASAAVGGTPGETAEDPDTDDDDLPDSWETYYGLTIGSDDSGDDADGDGSSNLTEYLAGTDPQDSSSVFTITSVTGPADDLMTVGWSGLEGKTYQFWTSPDLETWTPITPTIQCTVDGAQTTEITSITGNTSLFVRISVVP